jgi:phytanoyl-CoA hydroxylase
MAHDSLSSAYQRDGYVLVPDLLGPQPLAELREIIAKLVAASKAVSTHTAVYDLEPGHTAAEPRVRRIKTPHKVHPAFEAVVRSAPVMEVLTELLGPNLRLKSSKLNMKAARYGSPVEWHQDWAFYPHTNDDLLTIGVMLDDMDLDNGPLMIVPGSHKGPIWNHHGEDSRFCGVVNPDDIKHEIASAVVLTGRAGTMSFHHVRALHGSALNTSHRSRNLLLYEVAAADAWPLLGVSDFDDFNRELLSGRPVLEPRMTSVPVRLPLPSAARQGSIYENQLGSARSYFQKPRV